MSMMALSVCAIGSSYACEEPPMPKEKPVKAVKAEEVPVEYVEKGRITQVVVSDGYNTYVMATEERVADTVMITNEMANNAQPYKILEGKMPEIFTIDQAANSGNSDGTTTPFTKVGRMEPVTSKVTVLSKVYFLYEDGVYAFETTKPVTDKIILTQELLAKSVKQ